MRLIKFVLLFFLIIAGVCAVGASFAYFLMPKLQQNVAILVLGKGGEGHTAPDLTDTMMIVYLNNSSKKISVLPLPRDIWISEIRAKLNTAYYYGGFKMAGESAKSITGIPITHTVVLDFSLFKDLVNALGGINVEVENSFTDNKFPIVGRENDLCGGDRTYACRYETIRFARGRQFMDGETALKFVRSRNAEGEEGTDLAREIRQQKVISAIKEKVLSKEIIFNPLRLKEIYDIAYSHVETNLDNKSLLILGRLIFESRNNINFLSIPDEFLTVSQNDKKYDFQYVFISKSETWAEFQEWIKNSI